MCYTPKRMKLSMRLGDYLQAHNLTAYKLEKAVSGVVSRNTVYKWAREKQAPDHIHTAQFVAVVQALTRLTGKPVTPNDLLEVIEDPEPQGMDEETRIWMNNSASDMAARLADIEKDVPPEQQAAWLEANHKAAKPVKYVAGQGFVEAIR
jgi:hypothetical protein